MALHIIGAGFGRTGTLSLKLALEQLGVGPCFHMETIFRDAARQVPLWVAAGAGQADWDAIYEDHAAAVDWPTAFYWRTLAAKYPASKVILTTRSAETWFASFSATTLALMAMPDKWPAQLRPVFEMGQNIVAAQTFGGRMADREHAMNVFTAHEAEVKRTISAHRLLVWNVAEGWEPLCKFLGRPCPDTAFPKTNAKQDFWNFIGGPPAKS